MEINNFNETKKRLYNKYNSVTNMSFKDLYRWSRDRKSNIASLKPSDDSEQAKYERSVLLQYCKKKRIKIRRGLQTAIIRNLVLKFYKLIEWDLFLVKQSIKALKYIARHKIILRDKLKKLKSKKLSNNTIRTAIENSPVYIGLVNWAYDYYKK